MGNLSSKRHDAHCKIRHVVNNNAYNLRNDKPFHSQFTPIDSTMWPKPKRPPDLRLFEPPVQNHQNEVSEFLGKNTTMVDLSDTSTLTVSSDEISSRSSSDTLHPTQPSIRNQSCADEKTIVRSECGDGGAKSIATSDYLNLESLSTPTGCNRFQPNQISNILDDSLLADVPRKPPIRNEIKPPAQPRPIPPPCTSRQSLHSIRNIRSSSRLSVTPGLRPGPRQPNRAASAPKLPDRQPQLQATSRSAFCNSTGSVGRRIPKNTPVSKHIRQIENHNSQQAHHGKGDHSIKSATCSSRNDSHNLSFTNNTSHLKNVSLSNLSANFSSTSPFPRQFSRKGSKTSLNMKSILLSPKDSSQSYIRSLASNPKSSKRILRPSIRPKSPKVEHGQKLTKTHGLRKISDSEYQKYNSIINDFHYYMKSHRNSDGPQFTDTRSPSVESKISSIDNPKSKAYDETDDEIYSFPVSTTHVRPPSQIERSQSVGSFGDFRQDTSLCSNHTKSIISSGRSQKHSTVEHRSSMPRSTSSHNYIVEIDGNINELKRRVKDPRAIFCYKFLVNDGYFMQKMLADSKDHRIETICRQTACRIHVKRRWLRHNSKPPSYEIIVFARELKSIEKCCKLFNVMFPSFNAEVGLGYQTK